MGRSWCEHQQGVGSHAQPVSEEVDRRLVDTVLEPFELAADEWRSGDIIWLVDVIAAPEVSAQPVKAVQDKVGASKTIRVRAQGGRGAAVVKTIRG